MMIKVKPNKEMTVIHPETGGPITGIREIERTPAVIRLIKHGDLIELKPTAKTKPAKKTEKKHE
jgi:hypothetical protein